MTVYLGTAVTIVCVILALLIYRSDVEERNRDDWSR